MQIRAAEQEYRGLVARQPILPEMTSHRKWSRPNFKNLSRDSEQADTADHVYRGLIRVWLIFSEKSASLCLECQNRSKNHPRNTGSSILSDHAHFCYVCHVTICKLEPLNKNIAVSLPGNQYYRKWRHTGSDHARILKICHVILNKQTPLTTYIAVSFARDWYFPRNRLPCVSSVKTAVKITPETQGARFWATTPTFVTFVTWLYAN